jgi:hypothetical protein
MTHAPALVCSTIEAIAADDLAVHRIFDAVATVRQRVWRLGAPPAGWQNVTVPVYVDIDATLVTAHSEKDRAAGTYKGGFGSRQSWRSWIAATAAANRWGCCCARATPPRAPSPTTPTSSNKPCSGCPPSPTANPSWRGDSAMATCGFVSYARAADVAVSLSLGDHPRIQAAIHDLHRGADAWTPAVRPDGQARDGAHAAELADVPRTRCR